MKIERKTEKKTVLWINFFSLPFRSCLFLPLNDPYFQFTDRKGSTKIQDLISEGGELGFKLEPLPLLFNRINVKKRYFKKIFDKTKFYSDEF